MCPGPETEQRRVSRAAIQAAALPVTVGIEAKSKLIEIGGLAPS